MSIVFKALEEPVRQIAQNAGLEGSVIIDKIRSSGKVGYGFDAYKEEYCDMLERRHRRPDQGHQKRPAKRRFGRRDGPHHREPRRRHQGTRTRRGSCKRRHGRDVLIPPLLIAEKASGAHTGYL